MLFGFLVAYTNIRMYYLKEKKEEVSKNDRKYDLIYNDPSKVKNKYIFILLISILDFLGRSCELCFFICIALDRLKKLETCWLISIDIFSRILFCHFILKIKLYKHHWLSIAFCSVGFLINAIYSILTLSTLNNWIYLFFMFISKVFFALEDAFNKILLTDKLLLPHFLLFWRGIFNFIIISILTIILYYTSILNIEYYEGYLSDIRPLEVIRKICLIFLNFIKIFCIFKIIYIFTPQHVGFCNVIIYLFELIKYMIVSNNIENDLVHFIANIISLIFIIFGTLIFTEMMILNFWGLNENTKSGKIKKEKLDHLELSSTMVFNENEIENEDRNENLNELDKENND